MRNLTKLSEVSIIIGLWFCYIETSVYQDSHSYPPDDCLLLGRSHPGPPGIKNPTIDQTCARNSKSGWIVIRRTLFSYCIFTEICNDDYQSSLTSLDLRSFRLALLFPDVTNSNWIIRPSKQQLYGKVLVYAIVFVDDKVKKWQISNFKNPMIMNQTKWEC